MKQRARTIEWCEAKILDVLMKKGEVTTYLALSALVLQNVRSTQEQHNLDAAVSNLLSRNLITQRF